MKQIKLILVSMMFLSLFFMAGCGSQTDPREKEIIVFLNNQDYDGAIEKAKELYKGENKRLNEVIVLINKSKNMDEKRQKLSEELTSSDKTSEKLVIQSNWQYTIDGDYNYITGRVKNTSDNDIRYFKLVAEYLDADKNVLDTDYTNSTETIRPGSMKEFKIMHKNKPEYKQVRIFVEEVKTK